MVTTPSQIPKYNNNKLEKLTVKSNVAINQTSLSA